MNKLAVSATVAVLLVAAGCGGSKSTTVTQTVSAQPAESSNPLNDVFNSDRQNTLVLCNAYFSLVNQGWDDDSIYNNLSDAGTFDGMYGQGHEVFKALIKWCYAND